MTNRENTEYSPNSPKVVMLPIENKTLSQNLQNIIDWMNDKNPTLIVNPNIEYGYSTMLLQNNTLVLQKPEVPSIDYKNILTNQTLFPRDNDVSIIPIKFLTFADFFTQLTNLQSAFLPEPKRYPISKSNIPYPNVSELYTGQNIPINIYGLGDSMVEKLKPDKGTIIELYIPNNKLLLLSGKILESSGSSELDSIALKNLTTKELPENIYNTYKGNVLILKVEWTPMFKKNKED